jgi:membrane protein DedA with SNARE-associated domain
MSAAGLETWVVAWGYAAIFVVVLLGNIGVPVPEEIVLLVAGYLAWRGALAVPAVILVGALSAVMGDSIGYWLGRTGGRPLLLRYGRYIFIPPRQVRRAEQFFASHGRRAIFFGRFLAGIRFLVGPLAGIARMPFRRFFLYNAGGAVVYVPAVTLVGYGAGRHLHALLRAVQRMGHLLLLVVGLLLAGAAWRACQRANDCEDDERGMSWEPGRTRQIVAIR